jgi:hypothetical protein
VQSPPQQRLGSLGTQVNSCQCPNLHWMCRGTPGLAAVASALLAAPGAFSSYRALLFF